MEGLEMARAENSKSVHGAAGAPYRRARAWAWLVFWSTAGSSVLYNSYHALVRDHMPWYTGLPEGFLPLLVAIGVLEFAAAWRDNKLMQGASWVVTVAAMAWSALQINSVVHGGWAFGLIGDGAALAAMYFLLNGPKAQAAIDAIDKMVAGLRADLGRALAAKAEAEESARRMVADAQTAVAGRIEELAVAHAAEAGRLRTELDAAVKAGDDRMAEARRVHQAAVSAYEKQLADARSETEKVAARTAVLERKLAGPARRSPGGTGRSRTAPGTGAESGSGTAPDDLELEARALKLLAANLEMSGADLAKELGVSAGYGRKLRRRLAGERPGEAEPGPDEDRSGTAAADRFEDRG